MSFNLQVFLLSSFPLLLVLLLLKSYFSSSKSHKNLPPSPPKLPLIGNLHQMAPGPHRALQSMAQTYGPIMLLHFGTVPVVVFSTVEGAKEIMKTHDVVFSNRPFLDIGGRLTYDARDIVFASSGEQWRQMKSISVLHLLSKQRVQSYQQVREDETVLMIRTIQQANESVINLSELINTLTNNVISRVALGRKYERNEVKAILDGIVELLASFSVGNYIPWLGWIDKLRGLHRRADELAKDQDDFVEGVLKEHENKKESHVERKDLVDILLEIQRDNSTGFQLERYMIKAIIMDMFGAGTDTTSTTLEWTLTELLRNPRVMKKLQQEAQKVGQGRSFIPEGDIDKMPYLKAVLKESLRLHTPVPLLVPRESTKEVKIMGYDIPSGTQVIINAWAIARDPSIWDEPEKFKPERFLNSPIDYKGVHYEFTPFGAGRRKCPGITFAMVVNEVVLANLVYKFDFGLPGEEGLDMTEDVGFTVHKKLPVRVVATPCE
ncbi:putative cytochrome P450 [Helianthus annuus]|uniref:Cytochrome P450 n=1 Tax=Helianthus annuus TaxID=4232 RepID=F8S1H5_HELAN|nr:cytochrome P450 [Helianthus annuus]KAJ0578383.1 putative cytochrome P450 [Helianthus annuus]